ncbi:MAG: hypothetical protein HYT75_01120 [Deltaproteobacteria bacterium]|nr:hypothetical protein [Deltaproteobacteria bacterium]MBI2341506.1 hypothetical protein [Deltaproteobacteria bacterium]
MAGNNLFRLSFAVLVLAFALSASAEQGKKALSGLNIEEFEQKKERPTDWSKNPFVIPAADVAVSELKLSGIVYSEKESAAIVSDNIVKIGDKIGSNEVVAIEKMRVVIRNENGLFGIALSGGK